MRLELALPAVVGSGSDRRRRRWDSSHSTLEGGAENSGDSDNDEVQARTEQPRILRGQGETECPDDENSL